MEAEPLHAWVDESINVGARVYVVAAAIAKADERLERYRDVMRAQLRGRRKRVHWREESRQRKSELVGVIAALGLEHVVVVATRIDAGLQERARRKCREQLLFHLSESGVSRVWVEGRSAPLNARDIKMVDVLRIRSAIPRGLRLEHIPPSIEPMLWIPDVVAGTVSAARAGDGGHRAMLDPVIREIEVPM